MDIARIALSRHTCKAYDPARKIPAEQIEQLKTLLRYAPSSVNSQPWHFIIASTEAGKARIAKSAQQGVYASNGPKILNASHVVVLCARTTIGHNHLADLLEQEETDGRLTSPEAKATQKRGRNYYVDLPSTPKTRSTGWRSKSTSPLAPCCWARRRWK